MNNNLSGSLVFPYSASLSLHSGNLNFIDLFDIKFQCISTQVNILETVHWLMKFFLLLQTIRRLVLVLKVSIVME